MTLENYVGWFKAHERLVLTLVIAIALLIGVSKVLNAWEKHDQKKLDALQQQLDNTKAQVAQAQQNVADAKAAAQQATDAATKDKAAAAAIIQSLSAQNAALNNAMLQRSKDTQKQQQTDLSASIPELGKRFVELVPNVNPQDVAVAPDQKSVTIGQDTAQKTVAQLEVIPQLQQDKKDLQTENGNLNTELDASQKALQSTSTLVDTQVKLITAQTTNIDLLNRQLTQADAVCEQKVKVERDKARKNFVTGSKWGAIFGFIGGVFVGHRL